MESNQASAVELTDNQKYVAGLRELADWYERHPDAPMPNSGITEISIYNFDATRAEIKAIGAAKKVYSDSLFYYIVELENAKIKFVATRSRVCTPKVVGFREIPEQHIEAHTIPATREDIVEWECKESLLEGADDEFGEL